jgi:hypothetical protein
LNNVENDIVGGVLPVIVIVVILTAACLGAVASATLIHVKERMLPGSEQRVEHQRLGRITRIIQRSSTSSRPRVMVNSPEIKTNVCQICLGRIKEGSNHVEYSCGKQFHVVCLSRTSFCPYCSESFENLEPKSGEDSPIEVCPLCGTSMEPGMRSCECGAIFQEEGIDFCCPICGTHVSEGETSCPYCGEIFDCYRLINCPVCGLLVEEDIEVCECGAVLNDRCPECGAPLGPEDRYCRKCGAEFEFV